MLAAACGEGGGAAACLPDDVQRCTCDDGRSGFRVCDSEGRGYGACACDLDASPGLPRPATADATAGAEGGGGQSGVDGGLSFLSPCEPGGDPCPPGTSCDNFPSKGPHCSKPCKKPSDCPPPSPGCNPLGICRAP
jgi:hypothetical protein